MCGLVGEDVPLRPGFEVSKTLSPSQFALCLLFVVQHNELSAAAPHACFLPALRSPIFSALIPILGTVNLSSLTALVE